MSNTNVMESKITIHTGADYKPVIKVVEKQSEDVRDNLVQGFRELLRHESKTLFVEFIDNSSTYVNKRNQALGFVDHVSEYNIIPIEDELKYFEERTIQLALANYSPHYHTMLPNDIASDIRTFFGKLRNTVIDYNIANPIDVRNLPNE